MVKFTLKTWILIFLPIGLAIGGFFFGFFRRDIINGLAWALVFGVLGLGGELIVDGVFFSTPRNRLKWIGGLLAIGVLGAGIGYMAYVGILGTIFGPPAAPPEELATGYAQIWLVDGYTGDFVDSSDVHLIHAYNISAWKTDQATGTTFYVPSASVFWVNVSGYYPVSNTLFASGGDDPNDYINNTVIVFKRAYPENVTAQILRWRDVSTGIYNYSGYLPDYDGVYELEIRVSINMPSRNISAYGYGQWVPNYTLPVDSFAYNMSLNFVTLWLGWNATLHDYYIVSDYWEFNDVYDINILNSTMIPAAYYDTTYTIIGNFSNLYDVRIYDLTIDDYNNYSVKLI